jgi:membrane-associated phospholipid phosphatase
VRADLTARDIVGFGAVTGVGALVSYGVMRMLGPVIMSRGPAIDEPVYRWTVSHQVEGWAAIMERFNKLGNSWTIWGAAGTGAACLAVTWPRRKWLPPTALASAVFVDKYVTLALRRKFSRVGPPGSPLGTYPSGGCDRAILFYGLIAHMLWREFSGSYRGKVWATGAVAALTFTVAYCREYLSRHWFTDILTGLLYGLVQLAPFLVGVRLVAGPAGVTASEDRPAFLAPRRLNLAAARISPAAELTPRTV